jgi:hypothetical protein
VFYVPQAAKFNNVWWSLQTGTECLSHISLLFSLLTPWNTYTICGYLDHSLICKLSNVLLNDIMNVNYLVGHLIFITWLFLVLMLHSCGFLLILMFLVELKKNAPSVFFLFLCIMIPWYWATGTELGVMVQRTKLSIAYTSQQAITLFIVDEFPEIDIYYKPRRY